MDKHAPTALPYAGPHELNRPGASSTSSSASSQAPRGSAKNTATTKTGQHQSSKKSTPQPHSSASARRHRLQSTYEDPATSNRPKTSIREASIADALIRLVRQSWTATASRVDLGALPGGCLRHWNRPAVVIGAQGEERIITAADGKDHTRDAAQERPPDLTGSSAQANGIQGPPLRGSDSTARCG